MAEFGGKKRRFHIRIREVGAARGFRLSFPTSLTFRGYGNETYGAAALPRATAMEDALADGGGSSLGANQSVTAILGCGMWGRRRLTVSLLRAVSRPKAPSSPERRAVARPRRDNSSRGPKVGLNTSTNFAVRWPGRAT